MEVIRMEQPDHVGPFTPPYVSDEFAKHVSWAEDVGDGIKADDEHPHHVEDVIVPLYPQAALAFRLGFMPDVDDDEHQYFTGVKDKQQFLHWFPKDSLKYFGDQGFKVSVYDVPDDKILWGKYQLLFDMNSSKLKETYTPEEYADDAK